MENNKIPQLHPPIGVHMNKKPVEKIDFNITSLDEKSRLIELKLEAFKLAKIDNYGKEETQSTPDLIKAGELIYESLISTTITSNKVAEEKGYSVQDNSFVFTAWLDSKKIEYKHSGHQTIILGDVDLFTLGKEWAAYKISSIHNSIKINK